jgi:transcriptional regulator with XRE-family HTH domain
MRTHIGSALRGARSAQGRTLRDVAKEARVSLGYLSEVERGQKEASSELLNSICLALNLNLSSVLVEVATQIKLHETPVLTVVDTNAA